MTLLSLLSALEAEPTVFYCNRDGLFTIDPVKGVDDKESGYDDSQERRELEKVADMLFGKV